MSVEIEPGRPVVLRGGTVLTMNGDHEVLHAINTGTRSAASPLAAAPGAGRRDP